jgi:high affinity Mn2+ porin
MIRRVLHWVSSKPSSTAHPRTEIVRRWVETADERCPLACVWFALPGIVVDQPAADQTDEPDSTQPAFSWFALKAGCLRLIHMLPAPSIQSTSALKDLMRTLSIALLLSVSLASHAQERDPAEARPAHTAQLPDASSEDSDDSALTMFPHSDSSRYLLAGQANIIFQAHGPFHSSYSGPNSLLSRGEYKTSLLATLYSGVQLRRNPYTETDAIFDLESAGGRGDSEALGLAGFTNLDVVRNPNLGSTPYIARVQLHQTIGLSSNLIDATRTPYLLAIQTPERRIELYAGKMTLPDYFDINAIGTDSHLQFMNWTVDNNGAWDYAADTRGYTYAAIA